MVLLAMSRLSALDSQDVAEKLDESVLDTTARDAIDVRNASE